MEGGRRKREERRRRGKRRHTAQLLLDKLNLATRNNGAHGAQLGHILPVKRRGAGHLRLAVNFADCKSEIIKKIQNFLQRVRKNSANFAVYKH
jgi:hypothetical protein